MARLNLGKIHEFLAKWAPPALAEEWDNVGLQVGSMQSPVRGILVGLDVTRSLMDEAAKLGANVLVTHHPLIFKGLRALDDRDESSRLTRRAARNDLNILSFHTNLDSTRQGLNDLLGEKIGLKSMRPLLPGRNPKWKRAGLGRVGRIKPVALSRCVDLVAKALALRNLRFVGDKKRLVSRVAVMTGSGGGYFLEAKRAGADVLITGDVKYHHALDAVAEGIAMIDIGHFAGEIGMVREVARRLRRWPLLKRSKIQVHETRTACDPLQFWPL